MKHQWSIVKTACLLHQKKTISVLKQTTIFAIFYSKLENSADETRSQPFAFQLLGTMPSEKTISFVRSDSYKNLRSIRKSRLAIVAKVTSFSFEGGIGVQRQKGEKRAK